MAVSDGYLEYVLDQLGRVRPVTSKKMFGGVGVYADGLFFALLAEDRLYFKVDDSNRNDFETRRMGPFKPYGEDAGAMQYYEVPGDVLDEVDALGPWFDKALAVAAAARSTKKKRR